MAGTTYSLYIKNNSGSKTLFSMISVKLDKAPILTINSDNTITFSQAFTGTWKYPGTGTFLGLATSSGATTPTYSQGSTITMSTTTTLYAVESGGSDKTLTVTYNGNDIITDLSSTAIQKTLKCNGKVMSSDIVVKIQ